MMALLFLSFWRIDFKALSDTSISSLRGLALLVGIKLVFLPVALYGVALLICPDYAIGVLLLSGCTGVVAPFAATVLRADVTMVLRMVIVTSVIVPFSLPMLVKLLAGARVSVLVGYDKPAGSGHFCPHGIGSCAAAVLAGLVRVHRGAAVSFEFVVIYGNQSGCLTPNTSGCFFGNACNRYADGCRLLICCWHVAAFPLRWSQRRRMRTGLSRRFSTVIVNNVLVLVFSSDSFGPLSPTLAAMYMFPFFTVIVMGNYWLNRKAGFASGKGGPCRISRSGRAGCFCRWSDPGGLVVADPGGSIFA